MFFNKEQEKYVRSYVPGHSHRQIADEILKKYGIKLTPIQVRTWISNRDVSTGRTGQFKKGEIHHKVPIGTERVRPDGYVWIKVSKPNIWQQKQRWIYEQTHGPLRQNERIVFADGNNRNFEIDNLIKVNTKELYTINRRRAISNFRDVTKANLGLAKLDIAISNYEKNKKPATAIADINKIFTH